MRKKFIALPENHLGDVCAFSKMLVVSWSGGSFLVGGFNPFEKYDRQIGFIFPKFRGENSKNLWNHHPVDHIFFGQKKNKSHDIRFQTRGRLTQLISLGFCDPISAMMRTEPTSPTQDSLELWCKMVIFIPWIPWQRIRKKKKTWKNNIKYLEPKWPLFWFEKALFWRGQG